MGTPESQAIITEWPTIRGLLHLMDAIAFVDTSKRPKAAGGRSIRQSECVNQSGQSSRLISTAWVVKKIALECWAPIPQDLNQSSL